MNSAQDLEVFQSLVKWSRENFNDLPWRNNRSLYTTLVSELMLQQTTVSTVLNHFKNFLKTYPTLESLASSTEEDLLISWKGLGYYRRAKSLLRACKYIHEQLNGEFPLRREALMDIPGIGPYTSSALLSIGAGKKDIAVDANLERVLARYYGIDLPKGPKLQKEVYKRFLDGELLSLDEKSISYRDLNESLMDLGRQICRARKVDCLLCPLKDGCTAHKLDKQLEIPKTLEKKKKTKFYELKLLRVIVRKNNQIQGYQKQEGQWLSGQFEVPTFVIDTEDKNLSQYPMLSKESNLCFTGAKTYKTSITKYKITNYILELNEQEFKSRECLNSHSFNWLHEKEEINLSTGSSKALSCLKK